LHYVDWVILALYFAGMLGVGFYFLKRNTDNDDYYVGGRGMGPTHIGLSVVATDVGGGFSIGLGGLGFTMGLSGSWMLFTGLLGAWLAAVLLVPRVFEMGRKEGLLTYPQVFVQKYGLRVAFVAAVISAIGYAGFTASQLLAGAKLASATIDDLNLQAALLGMGIIAVLYTSIGGMKAVIYTDTVQWILLMIGLIFIGIPICYTQLGGYEAVKAAVPGEFLRFDNVSSVQIVNWMFTILPIWFVGMTLYQRIYACRDVKSARRAWYLAGFLEWPVMALMGTVLGLFARVAWQQGLFADLGAPADVAMDEEKGLPMLLHEMLPTGLLGLMLAAYSSAILSTADSCLMAASGNLTTDILRSKKERSRRKELALSQIVTLLLGAAALLLASQMENVLNLMLYSYAFMVSGLLVPTIGMLVLQRPSSIAAITAMILGGGTTVTLTLLTGENAAGEPLLLGKELPLGLDANIFGIAAALISFVVVHRLHVGSGDGRRSD
jgi:SSS family solute:Na+ symporter